MEEYLTRLRQNGKIALDRGILDASIVIDEYESRGTRDKFWFNNYSYLFKKIYDNSYEDYAELIAAEIATLFDFPHAEYDLATFNGINGVITKNFLNEAEKEEMVTGKEIINEVYNFHILPIKKVYEKCLSLINGIDFSQLSLDQKYILLSRIIGVFEKNKISLKFLSERENLLLARDKKNYEYYDILFQKIISFLTDISDLYNFNIQEDKKPEMNYNNLFDLWSIIENYLRLNDLDISYTNSILKSLVNMFIFDIITVQGDRHTNNWGLIINREKGTVRLTPMFDNSNIFNLNRIGAINSFSQKLESLEKQNISALKKDRTRELLKIDTYHPKAEFKVFGNMFQDSYPNQIKSFLELSSTEFQELLLEKINLLIANLDLVFTNIERKIMIEIPSDIKKVIKGNLEINKSEIENILSQGRGSYN